MIWRAGYKIKHEMKRSVSLQHYYYVLFFHSFVWIFILSLNKTLHLHKCPQCVLCILLFLWNFMNHHLRLVRNYASFFDILTYTIDTLDGKYIYTFSLLVISLSIYILFRFTFKDFDQCIRNILCYSKVLLWHHIM